MSDLESESKSEEIKSKDEDISKSLFKSKTSKLSKISKTTSQNSQFIQCKNQNGIRYDKTCRDRVKKCFNDKLENGKHVEIIEKAIYNKIISLFKKRDGIVKANNVFWTFYLSIAYHLLSYIEKGKVNNTLLLLKEDDFCWSQSDQYREALLLQKEEDRMLENPEHNFSESMYTCGKCGGNKTFSYTKGTRAADEGETVFVVCICGNRWKEY